VCVRGSCLLYTCLCTNIPKGLRAARFTPAATKRVGLRRAPAALARAERGGLLHPGRPVLDPALEVLVQSHASLEGQPNEGLVHGDREVGLGLAKDLGVRVARSTLPHAEFRSQGVRPRGPRRALGRVLARCRRDVDLDSIATGGKLRVDRGSTRGRVSPPGDGETELPCAGVVGDGNLEGSSKGGALSSSVGGDGEGSDGASAVVVEFADLEEATEVDRVEIGLLESLQRERGRGSQRQRGNPVQAWRGGSRWGGGMLPRRTP